MGGDITQEMIRRRAEHNDCILYTLEVKHLLSIYHCEYEKSMVYGRSRPDRFHWKGKKKMCHYHSTIW